MRTPTPRDVLYRWHDNAMRGVMGNDAPVHPDTPECGWFKRKLVKGGVFVPARIWIDADIDIGTGELLSQEVMLCEVDGVRRDAQEEWQWLCNEPISEDEFLYMTALRAHAQANEPDHPAANPRRPVDWLAAPLPTFSKGDESNERHESA
ncbi:hypothetical protein [Aestuariivirga sp.]|uniref:hypothetical protein n=1 Tax=Aestuariivirga sp. TaxID=2650926 RepID=UPI0039E307C1